MSPTYSTVMPDAAEERPRRRAPITAPESRLWFGSLPQETKVALRELYAIRPVWNWIIVFYAALWAGSGWLMLTCPTWSVRLAGYIAIGLSIHGFFNVMHEGIHGNLFRKQRLDRFLAFVAGIPALSSAAAYRIGHLQHHRYNATEHDPNEIKNFTSNPRVLSIIYYLALIGGLQTMILLSPVLSLRENRGRERVFLALEYGVLFLTCAGVAWLAVRNDAVTHLLHLWLVPLFFAGLIGNVRFWAEHTLTQPGHPLTQSRTVTSNRVLSFLLTNANYHLEHHLFPGAPWYRLPAIHRLLQDEYRSVGTMNYRSYLAFLWDAFRTGVHGLAPNRVDTSRHA